MQPLLFPTSISLSKQREKNITEKMKMTWIMQHRKLLNSVTFQQRITPISSHLKASVLLNHISIHCGLLSTLSESSPLFLTQPWFSFGPFLLFRVKRIFWSASQKTKEGRWENIAMEDPLSNTGIISFAPLAAFAQREKFLFFSTRRRQLFFS